MLRVWNEYGCGCWSVHEAVNIKQKELQLLHAIRVPAREGKK